MILPDWGSLTPFMQDSEVERYYNILKKKRVSLLMKRAFDILLAAFLLLLLSPVMLVIALLIRLDSSGTVFFRQIRVTQFGKEFKIFKFRTMVQNAEQLGTQVTKQNDARVTKIGQKLRNVRLDEIPQLINILQGDMTFVGARPEVPRYVAHYTPEMKATLLLPAGVTSEASIMFKDEDRLLAGAADIDKTYIYKILPEKMKYNIGYLSQFNFLSDLSIIIRTALAVIR